MYRHIPTYTLLILLFYFTITTNATTLEKRQHEEDDFSDADYDQDDPPFSPPDSATTNYLNTSDESPTSINQDIYDTTKLFKNPPSITDINDYIQVKLYCEVDDTLCKRVENSLISAALRVYKVVQLKVKIVFQASYYSFCINKCANETYGWGSPSSQYTLNSLNAADSNFIYPQALAKQLAQFTDSSKWVSYDVAVEINHDIYMKDQPVSNGSNNIPSIGGFWFNSSASPIENNQVDMEYVILHQMIHGLGMISSWAPYFSDLNSPFQKLLYGLIQPSSSLKMMTPNPYWYITHMTGPTFVTGFQPSLIFDKFLNLFFSANNQTVALMEYGFNMQNFCVPQDNAFIVHFMNAFLNNATQSTRAKSIYVAMSEENTLSFKFAHISENSSFLTNSWLNQTYSSIQLSTGVDTMNTSQSSYYRPGICTSHVADNYMNTPDFLMTEEYAKGITLDMLIDQGYANVPNITYNVTEIINLNVTTVHNITVNNRTTLTNETTVVQKEQTTEYTYRSAIGPGILRILETIGYSTVLTNTNYTSSVIKSTKEESSCDDNNNNNHNYQALDDLAAKTVRSDASRLFYTCNLFLVQISCIILLLK